MNNKTVTPEEIDIVYKELAERFKNFVFVKAEKTVRKGIKPRYIKILFNSNTEDIISFTFNIRILAGDIQEIIGGHRRKGEINERTILR